MKSIILVNRADVTVMGPTPESLAKTRRLSVVLRRLIGHIENIAVVTLKEEERSLEVAKIIASHLSAPIQMYCEKSRSVSRASGEIDPLVEQLKDAQEDEIDGLVMTMEWFPKRAHNFVNFYTKLAWEIAVPDLPDMDEADAVYIDSEMRGVTVVKMQADGAVNRYLT